MSERLQRITAIVRADFLIRFRRPSTLVVFLILSAFAYLWIPDPKSGRALIVIENARALYNSAAIAMGTATLGTIFIGLAGFYVISNALKRDVLSRCGFVIASTTMRGSEYLLAKFIGNVVFLSTFMAGYMVSSMAMVIVRGEAALNPFVFIKQYLLVVPPAIVFVSALAIVFESVPWLSGKFGDVVYFFLWTASLGIVASNMEQGNGATWIRYFDFSSFGFLFQNLKDTLHTTQLSIGGSSFDAKKPLFVFSGLQLTRDWIAPRIGATLMPISLLVIARLFFHRFDPARVRIAGEKAKRTWTGRLNALAKPFARALFALGARGGGSFLASARADALMTITAFPLALFAAIGFAIASLAAGNTGFFTVTLPIAIAAFAIVIADIACREKRAGTLGFAYAAPMLQARFVLWKLTSTLFVALIFLGAPLVRCALTHPASLPALLTGIVFVAAIATTLGVVSANPKTFIVVFLTFWYVALNDKGTSAALDFAGFYGKATPFVVLSYTALAAGSLALAHAFHAAQLRRA
ncbi:MAG TPA: hypothetical protein VMU84_16815 [Thermoanaerobaculia bacterium]|nr:hypothetical protein [Thermoanaerobaculia bacterium]